MNFAQYLNSGPTLRPSNEVETPTGDLLVKLLGEQPGTVRQLMSRTGLSRSAVWNALNNLRDNKRAMVVGKTTAENSTKPSDVWGVWRAN